MKIFDSHIHLDAFSAELHGPEDTRSARALAHNPNYHAFVPGTAPEQTRAAIEHTRAPRIHCGAALHPWYIPDHAETPGAAPELADAIRALAERPDVVAVGETGLDHYKFEPHQRAKVSEWFRWHIELARQVNKPLVVHCVRAHGECLDILSAAPPPRGGVIHAFSASREVAERYTALGFRLGIGSAITRTSARRVREAAREVPLEHLLIETDAPYIAASPRRSNQGRAADIYEVCETLAALRAMPVEEVAEATFANASALFGL